MTSKPANHGLPPTLSPELSSVLRGYALRIKAWRLLSDVSLLLLAVFGVVVASCLFDRLVDVGPSWRAPLPWLAALVLGVLAVRAIWRVAARSNFDQIAHDLDRASEDSRDHLRTILDAARNGRTQGFFAEHSRSQGLERWRGQSVSQYIIATQPLILGAASAVLILACFTSFQFQSLRAGLLLQRFLNPAGNYMRPSSTWFETSLPEKTTVRAGDDMHIVLSLVGRPVTDPAPCLDIHYADGTTTAVNLTVMPDGRFEATLIDLRQDFTWTAFLDDARTGVYTVNVLPRPTVLAANVAYEFPTYTRFKTKSEKLVGRTVTALEGTKVRLEITTNTPIREAVGTIALEDRKFRITSSDAMTAVLYVNMEKTQRMAIRLVSKDGIESRQELPFTFRSIIDNPPVISLVTKPEDREYSEAEVISLSYKAQDDIGLSEILLRVDGGDEMFMNFREYGSLQSEGSTTLPVIDLASMAGNQKEIKLRMVAHDTKGQEASSEAVTVRIAVNSFDHQLRLVRKSMNTDPLGYRRLDQSPVARANGDLVALRSVKGRIAALADGLQPNQKMSKDQEPLAHEIEVQLAGLRMRALWGTLWFKDASGKSLLDRFRRYCEYAVVLSDLDGPDAALQQQFRAAADSPDPKSRMIELQPALDRAIARQDAINLRVHKAYVDVTRELTGYLAATLDARFRVTNEREKASENFLNTNRVVFQEVADMAVESLGDELGTKRIDALKAVLKEPDMKKGLLDARPLLQDIVHALQPAAKAAALRLSELTNDSDQLLDTATVAEPLLIQMATMVNLENNDRFGDDLNMTQNAFRFLHDYNGTPGPFIPVGDRDPAQRARDVAAWNAYLALQRIRSTGQSLRVRLATGQIDVTQPEFLDAWAVMRESWLALNRLQPDLAPKGPPVATPLAALIASSSALEGWTPPETMSDADLVLAIRSWETQADALCGVIYPDAKLELTKLRSDAAGRLANIQSGFERLRQEFRIESEKFDETHLLTIQLHIGMLQATLLKSLDIAEMAKLHRIDDNANLDQLLGLYTLSGKLLEEFVTKVAADIPESSVYLAGVTKQPKISLKEHSWKARVEEYKKIDNVVAPLLSLFQTGIGFEKVQGVISPFLLTSPFMLERQAMGGGGNLEALLGNPHDLLAQIMADRNRAQAVFAELHFRVFGFRQMLKAKSSPAELSAAAKQFSATVSLMPDQTPEVRTIPDLLGQCALIQPSDPMFDQLMSEVGASLDDLKSAMGITGKGRSPGIQDQDQVAITGSLVAVALKADAAQVSDVPWAVGQASINRRKDGLSKKKIASGGVAIIGDNLGDLKLPKHLFMELKRSRERAMPELFRDRSYDYLNAILEKSQ